MLPTPVLMIGLAAGLSVIQITMLPIEPCMSELMGENISSSRDGKSLTDIDGFRLVVPNPVRVGILPVHLRVGDLPDHDVVAEWKDDLVWYSHRAPRCL